MILLLDTATPECRLTIVDDDQRAEYTWHANRELADGLLHFIANKLRLHGADFYSVTGIGVMKGPGSFTGLRIGTTVMNTLADTLSVPIMGAAGDDWQNEALNKLQSGVNDKIVLPEYGQAANVTKPRK